jgi:hypothetical protein
MLAGLRVKSYVMATPTLAGMLIESVASEESRGKPPTTERRLIKKLSEYVVAKRNVMELICPATRPDSKIDATS